MKSVGPKLAAVGMKQDDKLFTCNRQMPKEMSSSMACPSFRVYYGGAAGSVPFEWESRPGTLKRPLNIINTHTSHAPPPLTPPPSFHYFSNQTQHHRPTKKLSTRSKLFNLIIFPMFRFGRKAKNPTKPSSLSSSFSLASSPSVSSLRSSSSLSSMVFINHEFLSNCHKSRKRDIFSSFDSSGTTDTASTESPTSTLCSGIGRSKS